MALLLSWALAVAAHADVLPAERRACEGKQAGEPCSILEQPGRCTAEPACVEKYGATPAACLLCELDEGGASASTARHSEQAGATVPPRSCAASGVAGPVVLMGGLLFAWSRRRMRRA